MGLDTRCSATFNKQTSVGRAQLETDHVLFRGDFRVKLALAAITGISTKDGVLSLKSAEGTLALALGAAADKWAAKIGSPKSRVEKLGVKPGARVSVLGVADHAFRRRADGRWRRRLDARPEGTAIRSTWRSSRAKDLARFKALLPSLCPDGAIWAIRRKGLADASEAATMAAGKAAGLVDVKVARFSETHTAEKFVRPVATRAAITTARRREGAKAR